MIGVGLAMFEMLALGNVVLLRLPVTVLIMNNRRLCADGHRPMAVDFMAMARWARDAGLAGERRHRARRGAGAGACHRRPVLLWVQVA